MRAPRALGDKEVGPRLPQRADYATYEDYVAAFHFHRAVRRDAFPTFAELEAWNEALCWKLGIPYRPAEMSD